MERVALVTGGSRGAGRGIAIGLAEEGFDVALTYRRGADEAAETVAAIEKLGRRAVAIQSDVSVPEDNERAVTTTVEELGGIHALILNAGIASRGRTVADTDPEELRRVMSVHALGPHHLCSVAVPHLRQQERGDIVFISSVATLSHNANGAPYNMGKAAMESLAMTLSKEERAHGIRVNVVAPGLIDTEMGRRLVKGAANIDDISTVHEKQPFGRVCTPEDIADAVRFFVSDRAFLVTGEKLNVWGGGQEWR